MKPLFSMVTELEAGECKQRITCHSHCISVPSRCSQCNSDSSFHTINSGSSRELKPEEFARSDRAHFDGYKMSEQGDFRRQLADDQKALRKQELEELMGVAAIAGISVKNPKDRLNKFEDAAFPDDDEELDLSI